MKAPFFRTGNNPTSRFLPIATWSAIMGPLVEIPAADDDGGFDISAVYAAIVPFRPFSGNPDRTTYYGVVFVADSEIRLEGFSTSRDVARRELHNTYRADCIVADLDSVGGFLPEPELFTDLDALEDYRPRVAC